MGSCPADLLEMLASRPPAPTFAEYVPVVAATVTPGTPRAYGSYWNRVVKQSAGRDLPQVTL
jgi:integrase/recombinase XerC